MNKLIQSFLLVAVVSLAAAARLSIMGWFGLIGIGLLVILGFGHFYIHFYAMNSLESESKGNVVKILISHICFLNFFFFQIDADDSRTYLVFNHFLGQEDTALGNYAALIIVVSLILYSIVAFLIVQRAKKQRLTGTNHSLLIPSVLITFFLPFALIQVIASNMERQGERKMESNGIYSDIKRAIKEKEKVRVLEINSYEITYTSFPMEILELQNLEELYLDGQKISSIPDNIGRLKNLEIIDLVNNNIDQINSSICNCKKLKDLRVGGSIDSLPFCLTQLDSLKNLTIQSNSVNELMDELRKFKTLKTAHFYTNGILFDREKWWKLTKELGLE